MELGITWFRYVPEWKGNRDLNEDEQLSLEIKLNGLEKLIFPLMEDEG